MDKAVIADRKPIKTELSAGKEYYWCACGRSASQPFCDGSHRGDIVFAPGIYCGGDG